MCGIAAIASPGAEIPPGAIQAMTQCVAHRGPDGQGCVTFSGCHLGHRRLSVIDLATGDQPMSEAGERYWITYNGEIFNYRELRADLMQRGWAFRTQSDTEVILRAYQQYGDDLPTHLIGQFAFVIWDRDERRLFAARDRLGEKPLYWAASAAGHIVLASEIKALLASALIEGQIDREAVDAYLALLYVPPDRTIYANIHTLRPGHCLSWQSGDVRTWAYWQPAYSQTRDITLPEAADQLRTLLSQAVGRQMIADVPVGAFLSGGLDSSTIVALMTRHTARPVSTFAVGFGDLINELPFARSVAERYQTDHHEIQMNIAVGQMLETMAAVYDEPLADSSNIPTYLLAGFARQHVTVALSGDGGDELFGGYDWYRPLLSQPRLPAAPLGMLALAWHALSRLHLPVGEQREAAIGAYRAARDRNRYHDIWERHVALVSSFERDRSQWWGQNAPLGAFDHLRQTYLPPTTVQGLDRATDFDLRCYLPGDILVKVDRAALAHGLETRAPFLDADLVEFVLSLPWRLRFQAGQLKSLLRESSRDLWPDVVARRQKQGFGAPIARWLRQPEVAGLWQRVTGPNRALIHLLPGVSRARLSAQQMWTLLCLGLWLERRPECLRQV